MNVNGHELETKYVWMISRLKRHKNSVKWLDFLWKNGYREQLKKRLAKLEDSRKNGLLDKKAYSIYKSMIEKVLK